MPKINLRRLGSGYRSSNALNNDLELIEEAIDNTLSRDGTAPNQMLAPLDMNSNPIINLREPIEDTEPARLVDIQAIQTAVDGLADAVEVATVAAEVATVAAEEATDAAESIPGMIAGKANTNADNISSGSAWRTALETVRSPTVEKYGTVQLAADAASSLPFFAQETTTIVLTCAGTDLQATYDKAALWALGRSTLLDIQVESGDFTLPDTVNIENPYGGRIKISDAGEDALTLVSMGAITGSAGNYSIPLTVSSAAAAVSGRFLAITATTGTGSFRALNGLHEITSVVGNVVTIKVTCRTTSLTATLATATLRLPKTIIRAPANNIPFIYKGRNGDGSGLVVTVGLRCVVGSGTGVGSAHFVDSGAKVSLAQRSGVSGFQFGIRTVTGANVTAVGIIASNCETGVYALSGSQIQPTGAFITGCSGAALVASYGSTIAASTTVLAGNNRHVDIDGGTLAFANGFAEDSVVEGLLCANGGYILATNTQVLRYSENIAQGGVRATKGGFIDFGSSTANTAVTGNDLRAENGGLIRVVGSTFGRASPAVNTHSNNGAFIYTSDTPATLTRVERFAVGSDGATMIAQRSATLLQDVGSIPAQSTATFTITVPGVSLSANNETNVDWNGGSLAGIILQARVTAADTVTVQLHNITAAAIDPPSRTYRAVVRTYV